MSKEYAWLSDPEAQEVVFTISQQALSTIEPEEVPVLEGMFPNYMDLIQEGEVVIGNSDRPFAFAGAEGLTTTWLVPLAVEVLNSLLIAFGAYMLNVLYMRIKNRNSPLAPEPNISAGEMRVHVRKALDKPWPWLTPERRVEVEDCLVDTIYEIIYGPGG